jgi:hypothetical protein
MGDRVLFIYLLISYIFDSPEIPMWTFKNITD